MALSRAVALDLAPDAPPVIPLDALLSTFDTYMWEPLQRRAPWLHRLDDADWKTWVWHAALTWVFGHALGLLPGVANNLGMWLISALYVVREFSTRMRLGWRYKPLDGVMDVAGPLLVASLS